MSTDNARVVKTNVRLDESTDETPTRWTDWSVIQRRREERPNARSKQVRHERKILWLRHERNLSRAEACRQLRWEDVEVPEEAIR